MVLPLWQAVVVSATLEPCVVANTGYRRTRWVAIARLSISSLCRLDKSSASIETLKETWLIDVDGRLDRRLVAEQGLADGRL